MKEVKENIEKLQFGTNEYWKQRALLYEKSNDPTYSEKERNNCYMLWRILINKHQ